MKSEETIMTLDADERHIAFQIESLLDSVCSMREMVTKILDSIFFQRNLISICLASQFARSSECERLEATSCCSMTVSLVYE